MNRTKNVRNRNVRNVDNKLVIIFPPNVPSFIFFSSTFRTIKVTSTTITRSFFFLISSFMLVRFTKIVEFYVYLITNHICSILVEDLRSSLIEFSSIFSDIFRSTRTFFSETILRKKGLNRTKLSLSVGWIGCLYVMSFALFGYE